MGQMTADLLIKNARVVDGTGLPSYSADVEIDGERISRIGRFGSDARRVIDAAGRVLTPGFIDVHTHYDAQLHFEPTASPSSWHGVTTVITGNCGFTFAPARPDDLPWLIKMLCRVEGMSPEALDAGLRFRSGTFSDYLESLDGQVGVNVACMVGHAALRRWVMGEAASERTATSDEITAMDAVLHESLKAGALGFSSSQLTIHNDQDGRPVPPNWAAPDELIALAAVLADFDHGITEFFPSSIVAGYSDADRDLMLSMSEASGYKPMTINSLHYRASNPDCHLRSLAFVEAAKEDGHRIRPMYQFGSRSVLWSLSSTFLLDEMPLFREVLSRQGAERLARLRDPELRALLREEVADTGSRQVVIDWANVRVTLVRNPENEAMLGSTIAEIAERDGSDPLDALLDLSLSEDLEMVFTSVTEESPTSQIVLDELIQHPLTLAGSSDGGAHLQTFCGADYPTRLLLEAVPEVLSLEAAVAQLTMEPAYLLGLWDRGVIRPGNVADLVLLDLDALGCDPIRFQADFPTGSERVVVGAKGYGAVIVAGEVLMEDGRHTGALPGQVIRRGS
jgi:N-acyl-D-aspartate/D-glutamate deacylase